MSSILRSTTFGLKAINTSAKSLFLSVCSHCTKCYYHKYVASRNKTSMICNDKNMGIHKKVFLTRQLKILLYFLPMTVGWEILVQKKNFAAKTSLGGPLRTATRNG